MANEDDLVDSCEDTCSDVGVLDHEPDFLKKHCEVVKECKHLSDGWIRGFVRCDYCQCRCRDSRPIVPATIDIMEKKQFTEPDLYGTCTTTCPKSGLVRTKFQGCEEVKDCYHSRDGWIRGFVRCDYCVCTCVNKVNVNGYKLRNARYNLDAANISPGKPVVGGSSHVQVISKESEYLYLPYAPISGNLYLCKYQYAAICTYV